MKFLKRKLNKAFNRICSLRATGLCYVLALVAVVCVGFSSWAIQTPSNAASTVYGTSFTVYEVSNSSDYVNFTDTNGFKYYYSGFTDGNGGFTDSGAITTTVKINDAEITGFLESDYTVTFSLVADSAFLEGATFCYACDATSSEWTEASGFVNESENSFTVKISSKDLGGKINNNSFCIKFTLNCTGEAYKKLYDFLTNGNYFTLEATVLPADVSS